MNILNTTKIKVIEMLSQHEILEELSKNLNTWKNQYGVSRIALFGSYIREDQNETSESIY